MNAGSEGSTSNEPSGLSFAGSGGSNEAESFECNICFELAQDPIVTLCGHLFCWPCLYRWLHFHAHSKECPVCKAFIEEEKLVPLYGRGKVLTDRRSRPIPIVEIPNRPVGQRPAAAPPQDPNQFGHSNPWLMGGTSISATRFGNYTFSAAISGLFPYLNFQVHGFPDATTYAPAAGFPFGYPNTFHGGHVHGFNHPISQGQQADVFLKGLLIMVGVLLIAIFVCF